MLSQDFLAQLPISYSVLETTLDKRVALRDCGLCLVPAAGGGGTLGAAAPVPTDRDRELGIIGPEARLDKFVYASACLTKEAFDIDMDAYWMIQKEYPFLVSDQPTRFLHPVPSVYFLGTNEFLEWRYTVGTSSFPYVVLTCLSDSCDFGFMPHGEKYRDELVKLIRSDNRKLQSNSKFDFKNASKEYTMSLRRGDKVLLYSGCPFVLYGDNVIVKVSCFDWIKHFDTRVKILQQAMKSGGWKINAFGENSYYYLVPKNDNISGRFGITTDFTTLNFPIFTKSNFGKGAVAKIEKKLTMRQQAFAAIKAMPTGEEKNKKFAELKTMVFPDEVLPSSPAPRARSAAGAGAAAEEAKKQYGELIAEVSKLDPRVFDPSSLKTCSSKIVTFDTWGSTDVTKFKNALETLKKAVETAKDADKKKVPIWEANLVKIKELIDECYALLDKLKDRKKERNYIDGYLTQYNNILSQKDQYWKAEVVKDVERILIERLEKNKANLQALDRESSSSSSSGSSQKRERDDDEEEDEEDAPPPPPMEEPDKWPVPEIIDENLFPRVETCKGETVTGDGWRNYLVALNELDVGPYVSIVQNFGLQNKALLELHTTFRSHLSRLRDEIRNFSRSDPTHKYDFTKAFGYKGWMDKAVEYYKNLTEKQKKKNPPVPKAQGKKKKKKACKYCSCVRVMFPDNTSKYCAHCFIDKVVQEDFNTYETKVAKKLKHLDETTKEEYESISSKIVKAIDNMLENDNGKSITQEKYQTLKKMIDECQALVPVAIKANGEEDDSSGDFVEYDDDEDDDEDAPAGSKLISNSNLPSEESEASFTGESHDKKKLKPDAPPPTMGTVDDLAVDILHTMFRVPIKSVEDRLKKMYQAGAEKRELLVAYLKDLKTLKEMFGIELTSKDSGKVVMHHIHYETEAEAETIAMMMENNRLTTRVVTIPLSPPEEKN